jgi:hypothetical protein
MPNIDKDKKQNVTIKLDRERIRKAKMLAAQSSISLSELVARRIEIIFGEEESYERSELAGRELLERGFHLGGGVRVDRGELHERKKRWAGGIERTGGRTFRRRKVRPT